MSDITRRQVGAVLVTGIAAAALARPTAAREDEAALVVGKYQGTVWSASQRATSALVAKIIGPDKKAFAGKLGAEAYDADSLTWKTIGVVTDRAIAVQPAFNARVRFYLDSPDELKIGISVEAR